MRRCCPTTLRRPFLATIPPTFANRYATHAALYAPLTPEQSLSEHDFAEECFQNHTERTRFRPALRLPTTPAHRFDWRLKAPSRPRDDSSKTSSYQRPRRPRRVEPHHVRLLPGEQFYEEVHAYQKHFLPLLEAEQAEDEAVLKERLASWSLDRLRQEGYCITGLSAYWMENNQFGKPVATFALGPGIALPEHRFENGTQVLVTRLDPLQELPFRGSVVGSTATQLRICFQEMFDLDAGQWRLDVGRSNIVYERMCAAISQLHYNPAEQEKYTGTHESDRQFILQGTYLRDILLRGFKPQPEVEAETETETVESESAVSPSEVDQSTEFESSTEQTEDELVDNKGMFKDDVLIQSWALRYSQPDPVVIEGDPVLKDLNPTQIRAIAMMVAQRFTLVQGPPGTGKTKTIIEAVRLLRKHFQTSFPILLCTYTNVAVDNLVEGLLEARLAPLRIGTGGKVKESLQEATLEAKIAAHPIKPSYDQVEADIEALSKRRSNLIINILNLKKKLKPNLVARLQNMEQDVLVMERRLKVLRGRAHGMYLDMLHDIVTKADVVCTTCVTSASMALNVSDFPIVFVDEASMSTEPASLIPLMKGSHQVALIGDHKQLPPVITSPEAQAKGLGVSLFERMIQEGVVPSIMLDIQYRMHPMISYFPSHEFYDLGLRDGTVDASGAVPPRLLPPMFSLPLQNPDEPSRPSVIFLDHRGPETTKDRSRVNINEAHIVCAIVEDLLLHNEELRGQDIGIIAPYVAQISTLNRYLTMDEDYKKRFEVVLGAHRAMQLPHIEVKTVDGFEGREKDVVIFSTVRNNNSGHIGFLADRRRLNVGLTRAKRGLFVLGNIDTLKAGRSGREVTAALMRVDKGAGAWRRYAEFLKEEKLIVKLQGDQLRKVLEGNVPSNNVYI